MLSHVWCDTLDANTGAEYFATTTHYSIIVCYSFYTTAFISNTLDANPMMNFFATTTHYSIIVFYFVYTTAFTVTFHLVQCPQRFVPVITYIIDKQSFYIENFFFL